MRGDAAGLVAYWRARCRVELEGDCLVWAGAVQASNGRPQATYKQRRISPQRELFRLVRGDDALPDRMPLFLTCRNPRCMTVEHMRPMSHNAYFRRLARNGELKRGPAFAAKGRRNALRRAASRLRSIDDARAIRAAVSEGHDRSAVAERFGITRDYVNKIVRHRSWREASPWAI